jgi:hypothetical protein
LNDPDSVEPTPIVKARKYVPSLIHRWWEAHCFKDSCVPLSVMGQEVSKCQRQEPGMEQKINSINV